MVVTNAVQLRSRFLCMKGGKGVYTCLLTFALDLASSVN
jgi:hypothetical protein